MKGSMGVEFTITDTVRNYVYLDATTTAEYWDEYEEEEQHMAEYRARTGRHWIATAWHVLNRNVILCDYLVSDCSDHLCTVGLGWAG